MRSNSALGIGIYCVLACFAIGNVRADCLVDATDGISKSRASPLQQLPYGRFISAEKSGPPPPPVSILRVKPADPTKPAFDLPSELFKAKITNMREAKSAAATDHYFYAGDVAKAGAHRTFAFAPIMPKPKAEKELSTKGWSPTAPGQGGIRTPVIDQTLERQGAEGSVAGRFGDWKQIPITPEMQEYVARFTPLPPDIVGLNAPSPTEQFVLPSPSAFRATGSSC
jgi:hypothetical protein